MKLTFLPEGVSYGSDRPVLVSEAAAQCDLLIEHPCGTRGRCTRCRVRFVEGAPQPTEADRAKLSPERLDDGWRLSCQALLRRDATIEIPEASRATGGKSFGPDLLPGPPDGDAAARGLLGIALDLGSTTVAGALVELGSSRVVAHASTLNAQARFGGDVISRIRHAMDSPQGEADLTDALRLTVRELVEGLVEQPGARPEDVTVATACGNGAMTHSFVGESVVGLGLAPYHGVFAAPRTLRGLDLGWTTLPDAAVRVFPQVASHVGGDTVAAILATGMHRRDRPELLVDLGTNTEIVLAARGRLTTASAAAGPAFEGAEITHGMRATAGAIDRVSLGAEGQLLLRTVGGADPVGVCGTGLIDATAALLELGLIEPGGRLVAPGQVPPGLAPELVARLRGGAEGNHAFELVPGGAPARVGADAGSDPVALYARDVRQLQLVKGSIMAAVELLLDDAGVPLGELRAVHVAGAFGTRLRKWTALRIGLVPAVDPERIRLVGDAAATGARMALCRLRAWEDAVEVAGRVRHVELATDARYTDAFARAIPFPSVFPDPVERDRLDA
ncbi:MAG: ASKHA domain-containing protein [Gemmatimonadota bacterium]